MGLIDFPDPVAWIESAKTAGFERELLEALVSSQISMMWRAGQWKPLAFLADGATAMYLSLTGLQAKGLRLSVPAEMKQPENLKRFTTEEKT